MSSLKRYRASVYMDISAGSQAEAEEIGRKIAQFLLQPEGNDAPKNYYEPYFGGAGELVGGDLIGNHERLKRI